jgi:hypothetical protein
MLRARHGNTIRCIDKHPTILLPPTLPSGHVRAERMNATAARDEIAGGNRGSHYRPQESDPGCASSSKNINFRVPKACPLQYVTGVIADCAQPARSDFEAQSMPTEGSRLVPPTDPIDPTAVQTRADDFQILLVESTFCPCRFIPRTSVSGLAWLPFGTAFSTPLARPGSYLATQNMSVVNQLFQSPS